MIEKERANAVYRRNYELFLEDLAAGEFHSLNLDLPSDSNSNVIENLDESAALEEGEGIFTSKDLRSVLNSLLRLKMIA